MDTFVLLTIDAIGAVICWTLFAAGYGTALGKILHDPESERL